MSSVRSFFSLFSFEPVLVVWPSLAKAIGLHQAIVVAQVLYCTYGDNPTRRTKLRDGNQWTNLTLDGWADTQLGKVMSVPTLKRTFQYLEKSGLLEACQPDGSISRRKYYRVPESVIIRLNLERIHELTGGLPWDQFDPIEEPNLIPSSLEEYNRPPEEPNQPDVPKVTSGNPRQASDGPVACAATVPNNPSTPYRDNAPKAGHARHPRVNSKPHGNSSGGKGDEIPLREQSSVGRPSPTPLRKTRPWWPDFLGALRRVTYEDVAHREVPGQPRKFDGYFAKAGSRILKQEKERQGEDAKVMPCDLEYVAKLYKAYQPPGIMTAQALANQWDTLLTKDLSRNRKIIR